MDALHQAAANAAHAREVNAGRVEITRPDGSTYRIEQATWDSESRISPYSTVSDPYTDDDFCEVCDGPVDYSPQHGPHGRCRCDDHSDAA